MTEGTCLVLHKQLLVFWRLWTTINCKPWVHFFAKALQRGLLYTGEVQKSHPLPREKIMSISSSTVFHSTGVPVFLTLTMLNYFFKPWSQFEIILVSTFCFTWIPLLWGLQPLSILTILSISKPPLISHILLISNSLLSNIKMPDNLLDVLCWKSSHYKKSSMSWVNASPP